MRRRMFAIAVLAFGCARSAPARFSHGAQHWVTMDTAVARRVCADADSVIAGRRTCVLLDQSRHGVDVRKP